MALKKGTNEAELKMPKEQFGAKNQGDAPSYLGIVLGVLIVILMCILAGLYMWNETLKKNEAPKVTPESSRPSTAENNEPESTNAEAEVETLKVMSPSNELNAIESDLQNTQISEPEADLQAIDATLQ